jgi:hypothetical protein
MDVRHPTILDYRDLAIEKCPAGTLSITRAADDLTGQWISYVLRAPILD